MSESSFSPLAVCERVRGDEFRPCDTGEDELGDAFAGLDGVGLDAVVDEDDSHFAAVIRVDGPRSVEHGDAVLEGKARSRPHLGFVSFGDLKEETGEDEPPLAWGEGDWFLKIGPQVHACGGGCLVVRKRVPGLVDDFDLHRAIFFWVSFR